MAKMLGQDINKRRAQAIFIFFGICGGIILYGVAGNLSDISLSTTGMRIFSGIAFLIGAYFGISKRSSFGYNLSLYQAIRLSMLGAALVSFIYATGDIYLFYHSGADFSPRVGSFALGSLLIVSEKLLELLEKGDL